MNRWHDHPEAESMALEHYHDYPGAYRNIKTDNMCLDGIYLTGEEVVISIKLLRKEPVVKEKHTIPEKVARMVSAGKKGLML